jgi:hypothetical protein
MSDRFGREEMLELEQIPIPDFTDLESQTNQRFSSEEIQRRFFTAADNIMRKYILAFGDRGNERHLNITALELYLYCASWPDPNTDKHSEQAKSRRWYVHRRGNLANRSRIDITAGSEELYCGLLIRGIDGRDGSGSAIKKIIRGTDRSPRDWLDEEIDILDTSIHGKPIVGELLQLKRREADRVGTVARQQRVGLRYPGEPWDTPLRAVFEGK